jgi:hypothetical protein
MQLVNPIIDNDLGGSWKGGYPTPAREDFAVLTDNTPPHIRQGKHQPRQPKPGQTATITAKITDSDGVAIVTLSYQPVASPVEVDEELRHLFRVLAGGLNSIVGPVTFSFQSVMYNGRKGSYGKGPYEYHENLSSMSKTAGSGRSGRIVPGVPDEGRPGYGRKCRAGQPDG